MTGSAHVIRGNALNLPLRDSSVDLVCTSPPYFGLRSYQDGGAHYNGQIGSEATPAEFVDALIAATREMVRVLKPSGSIFVNLGDKYATGATPGPQSDSTTMTGGKHKGVSNVTSRKLRDGVAAKSLIGIPWRYAIRCIDQLGLILRAEIIWSKPNGLPESVTDRVRRSHEQWFHFVRQPRYFSAVDEIREEHVDPLGNARYAGRYNGTGNPDRGDRGAQWVAINPLGKLPGSVWTIPTQPLQLPAHLGVDHFAAFPMEWPRRIIQGWSPTGICTVCGEGRRPVSVNVGGNRGVKGYSASDDRNPLDTQRSGPGSGALTQLKAITGYACGCTAPQIPVTFTEFDFELDERVTRTELRPDPSWINPAPTTLAAVVDPFGGTGTTALMAKALGRIGITIDMSNDYCRAAEWRTTDPGQLAAALQVEKPEPIPDGQVAFDFEGAL